MNIGPHVADDVLEKYLLERLPEAESASIEEHLLVCPKCQTQAEETQEFILATQAALRGRGRKPPERARRRAGLLYSWVSVPVFAAIVAAVATIVFAPPKPVGGNPTASDVVLSAMRGPNAGAAHVRAGGRLILHLDVEGLPADGDYSVRLVNSSGSQIWGGASRLSGNQVRAEVDARLRPGRYWVRLSRGGELVREYGLQVD